ncbi:dihydroxyacetone kinase family protein [Arthrobacter sp. FW306-07-I]|uniref:dihydroxyacetone kinase family protein n=1 Tax=Arthrobacter sp. FW306-07-I TaxID=2879622 RepID=UPI001F411E7D|nr:dihydroxyacetone kinase family protein [Arthrobacter sp. FW306-07-I]UKA77614.1 dihydroxyacetone kinase family protein [Arthrobacter sp. FW306-07-I]
MAYLFNNPIDFADQLTDGFAAAYPQWIRKVPGGVVRSNGAAPGSVVVITGGGSGHYPAFAGLVGPGLAHGAAMGNIFASPSAQQIYSVAKSAHAGGGVLLTYGNYAGDVLNFTVAKDRLNAEGIRTLMVAVTDDISSAPTAEIDKRRGIAGDLAVFKAAGACADAGGNLDEVFQVATRANERTRSFGIAFSGCTLPGAAAPLFQIPEGRMAVGMGIHGEPGISEQALPTADAAAELMVRSLLAEAPENLNGRRVGVILNGLGAVKSEELFVVYRKIAQMLDFAGIVVVDPEVGELVTSFEMAGVSLTLFWLDDELEKYWTAPASTPAFRKGVVSDEGPRYGKTPEYAAKNELPDASEASRQAAGQVQKLLETVQAEIDENAENLGFLDSVAGDGDHGIGMQRGAAAAADAGRAALAAGAGAGTLLSLAADAWADRAGGTSGVLWGLIIKSIGQSVGDNESPNTASISQGITEAAKQVMAFGKAELGDKTLVDVLIPFSVALSEGIRSGNAPENAWHAAAEAADEAAKSTASLVPKMGRARPHAEKSIGTPDPGAVSMAMIIRAVERDLSPEREVK